VFEYRILHYMPNRLRDEWVNTGVILKELHGSRQAISLIEEAS